MPTKRIMKQQRRGKRQNFGLGLKLLAGINNTIQRLQNPVTVVSSGNCKSEEGGSGIRWKRKWAATYRRRDPHERTNTNLYYDPISKLSYTLLSPVLVRIMWNSRPTYNANGLPLLMRVTAGENTMATKHNNQKFTYAVFNNVCRVSFNFPGVYLMLKKEMSTAIIHRL
jgi:hypothetical protein